MVFFSFFFSRVLLSLVFIPESDLRLPLELSFHLMVSIRNGKIIALIKNDFDDEIPEGMR